MKQVTHATLIARKLVKQLLRKGAGDTVRESILVEQLLQVLAPVDNRNETIEPRLRQSLGIAPVRRSA